ncbi:MAG: hypothetical protein ACLSB9_11235 [Hydrogeniiclostridium mannosilyticum]
MQDMGLLDEDGNLRTYEVEVTARCCLPARSRRWLSAGNGPTRTCKVGGRKATLRT